VTFVGQLTCDVTRILTILGSYVCVGGLGLTGGCEVGEVI